MLMRCVAKGAWPGGRAARSRGRGEAEPGPPRSGGRSVPGQRRRRPQEREEPVAAAAVLVSILLSPLSAPAPAALSGPRAAQRSLRDR